MKATLHVYFVLFIVVICKLICDYVFCMHTVDKQEPKLGNIDQQRSAEKTKSIVNITDI